MERSLVVFTLAPSFALILALLSNPVSADLAYVAPSSVSADASGFFGVPNDLISDAAGAGGVNYVAPSPFNGGGGTSWFTAVSGLNPVTISFDFGSSQDLDVLYLWDYNGHSPTDWNLQLFSAAAGSGSQLVDFDFTIGPGANGTSTRHVLDFTDVTGALSGTLTTQNNSTRGGVGLSEFGFSAIAVPEPTSTVFLMCGLGMYLVGSRHRSSNRR